MLPRPLDTAGRVEKDDVRVGPLVAVGDLAALRGKVTGVWLGGGEGRVAVSTGGTLGWSGAAVASFAGSGTGAGLGAAGAAGGALAGTFLGAGRVYTVQNSVTVAMPKANLRCDVPSGKRPLFPLTRCLPRNQPSPNSSSRSANSTRSPFARVNSSELRAWKSSAHAARISSYFGFDHARSDDAGMGTAQDATLGRRWQHGRVNSRMTTRMSPTSGLDGAAADIVDLGTGREEGQERKEKQRRKATVSWAPEWKREVVISAARHQGRTRKSARPRCVLAMGVFFSVRGNGIWVSLDWAGRAPEVGAISTGGARSKRG
jgi:hypothetical protein